MSYNHDGQTGRGNRGFFFRRISLMDKVEVYKTIVKPAMIYAAETWEVKKSQYVAEMRVLRWMSGVTKADRIRNERIRGI